VAGGFGTILIDAADFSHENPGSPMTDPKYAAFTALDPFFNIVQQGLAGLVDGDHYFDTIADGTEFEFRYIFLGWPRTLSGRDALMELYAGYGDNIVLDARTRSSSTDRRILVS
jgi:hypothetical protein